MISRVVTYYRQLHATHARHTKLCDFAQIASALAALCGDLQIIRTSLSRLALDTAFAIYLLTEHGPVAA